MAISADIREFLMTRRANLTPAEANLPAPGEDRRVPGLRREEVAMLAGVSLDYYTRLERGSLSGVSESVLNAVARALQFTDVEREHLFDLARPKPMTPMAFSSPSISTSIRTSVQRILDNTMLPMIVITAQQDVVASNLLGRALFAPHFDAEQPNLARFIFLDSRARSYYDDWQLACSLTAAMLRFEAGRDPLHEDMTALIGELSTRSPTFREHWAQRDVHEHRSGSKVYHHPEVGEIELAYDVFQLPGEHGLSICTYTAEEGSAAEVTLRLLGAWAASG